MVQGDFSIMGGQDVKLISKLLTILLARIRSFASLAALRHATIALTCEKCLLCQILTVLNQLKDILREKSSETYAAAHRQAFEGIRTTAFQENKQSTHSFNLSRNFVWTWKNGKLFRNNKQSLETSTYTQMI